MPAKFLDIKSMMSAVDTRNKKWYDHLPDEDKKLYSPYMTMKWTASVEHKEPAIHEFTIEEVNENVNKHLWTLSKSHKALLWRLTAMCGSTFKLFHKWMYPKKSKTMNLAFDVTPAKYVTGLITEKGICNASTEGLKKLFK